MTINLKSIFIVTCLAIFLSESTIGQCSEYDILNLKRIAVVFGEKDYKYAGALANPLNDAQDVSDSLKKVGFTVYTYYNSDFKTMTAALNDWYTKISKYDVAVFYYSGHGAEVSGENYLFPIDANPKGPSDLYYMAYSANRVLSNMESNNSKFNIMILDACRNNPFTKSWVRDFSGGLASMTGRGSFIGFAASPGTTASDGDQRNGKYTEAILKYLTIPNLTIDQIFTKVNSYVRAKTTETQVPYKNSSLSSDFCFSIRNQKSSEPLTKSTFIQSASEILLSSTEEKIFIPDSTNNALVIQDSKTLNTISTISANIHPFQITSRGGYNIYIIDSILKALVTIDPKNGEIKSRIQLKHVPLSITISPDEKKAYIAVRETSLRGGVAVIDLTQNKIIKEIATSDVPQQLCISTDGKYLYTTSYSYSTRPNLNIIDVKADKITKAIAGIANGHVIGLLPNNKKIYVVFSDGSKSDKLNVIDAGSLRLLTSIEFKPSALSFTPDGNYLFAIGDSEVLIISTADDIIINRLPFATQPKGIALSDDGRAFIWLPKEFRTIVFPIKESLKPDVSIDPELALKKFNDDLKRQSASDSRFKLDGLFGKANYVINSVVNRLIKELGEPYQNIQTGIDYNFKSATYSNKLGIQSKFDNNKSIWPDYRATFTDNLLVITLHEKDSEETYKATVNNIDWDATEQFVRTFFLKRINQLR